LAWRLEASATLERFCEEGVAAEDGGIEAGADAEGLVVVSLEGVDGFCEAGLAGLILDEMNE